MKKRTTLAILATMLLASSSAFCQSTATTIPSPIPSPHKGSTPTEGYVDASKWKLVWSDEFDYEDKELDKKWVSANHPSMNLHCSRWRENAVVGDGTLRLVNKKEQRGGQEWTSGSIWTKEHFLYGYYECRYRYAAATSTNNSFWIMTKGNVPEGFKRYEIDINEGHYPNNVNSNVHNWTDETINAKGKKGHPIDPKSYIFGSTPDIHIQLETPVVATKLRFSSKMFTKFNINEFRAMSVIDADYPTIKTVGKMPATEGLVNFMSLPSTKITTSNPNGGVPALTDGTPRGWRSQDSGEKWIEAEFDAAKTIGCIQLNTGWTMNGTAKGLLSQYKVEYFNGEKWVGIATMDVTDSVNFAEEFHTYGFEWTKDEMIFYLDGKEIRRTKNEFCHYPAPVWLSLAIIKWDGPLDVDNLDGTFMEVDYVRIYKEKKGKK